MTEVGQKTYVPIVKVSARTEVGTQRLFPAVADGGQPLWQSGDTNVARWEIVSMGWCRGNMSNRRDHQDATGTMYLTDSRVVVVSDHYAQGNRYTSLGIGSGVISAAAATKVSKMRAQHASRGTYLVAHMRLPWISRIVFCGPEQHKGLRGEVRFCGSQLDAWGERESVVLIAKLRSSETCFSFVDDLVERVRQDRLGWSRTTEAESTHLSSIGRSYGTTAADGQIPSIPLPGAFRLSAAAAGEGVFSKNSFELGK